MINLSKCKFGDRLKMRNGKMAIYVGKEPHCTSHFLVMDSIKFGYGMLYAPDNGVMGNLTERSYDIVGKWEEEIERPAIPYEIKPDMPKEIKPIKGVSEAMVEQWLQVIKHLK